MRMGSSPVEHPNASATADVAVRVHFKTIIVVLAINLIYFGQLFSTVGSGFLAQPIGELFQGSDRTAWLSTVINILNTALVPPISEAADYWGRKWFIIITQTCAFAGAVVVSRATSMNVVIAGFTVIGIGTGSQALLFSVAAEVLPRKYRPFAAASLNLTAGLAAITSVCMGGALIRSGDLENYRPYFYLAASLFGIGVIACAFCYNPPPRPLQIELTTKEKLRRLDWIGYFLLTPGLVLFCLALAWSQNPYSWDSVNILAPFLLGVALLAAFGLYEWRVKKDGMVHHGLFRDRNFPLSLVTIFVEGIVFFSLNSYYTFQVSIFEQADLLVAGLHFMILFLTTSAVAFVTAPLSKHYKVVRYPTFFGFLCLLLFNIILATVTPRSNGKGFWAYPIVAGAGMGVILPLIIVAGQLSTTPTLLSVGTGLLISIRALGASVGLAINTAIFNSTLSKNIPKKIAAAALPLGLPPSSLGLLIQALLSGKSSAIMKVPGVTLEIAAAAGAGLVEAYGKGFQNVWIAAACFSVVAAIAAFFFFDPKKEFNNHIDAPAEAEIVVEQARVEGATSAVPIENKSVEETSQHDENVSKA
ncbi:hypothetical protein LTR93_008086 [Exophiala xenobiotica]|nr:hypothetical protein LTR93_008086 [Exophiala xenobiotica]